MSDLSWLNPTPQAIAVYASQPLSPVATQHSLPSGRYSLLGPDFHRLDRTSLRLAHLLDHLVDTQQELLGDRQAEGPCRREIEDQFEPRWLFDRHIGWPGTLQNSMHVIACPPKEIDVTRPVGHESPRLDEIAGAVDHRQS